MHLITFTRLEEFEECHPDNAARSKAAVCRVAEDRGKKCTKHQEIL